MSRPLSSSSGTSAARGGWTLRRATATDAASLAQFAARTFSETFASDATPDNLATFLAATYSPQRQLSEIEDPAVLTLLAEIDGELAGFVQLRNGSPPPCIAARGALEVGRFYVASRWHGTGVARWLMSQALRHAHEVDSRVVWLGVFENNARARRFYAKSGFVEVGTHHFYVGDDRQRDVVMLCVPGLA